MSPRSFRPLLRVQQASAVSGCERPPARLCLPSALAPPPAPPAPTFSRADCDRVQTPVLFKLSIILPTPFPARELTLWKSMDGQESSTGRQSRPHENINREHERKARQRSDDQHRRRPGNPPEDKKKDASIKKQPPVGLVMCNIIAIGKLPHATRRRAHKTPPPIPSHREDSTHRRRRRFQSNKLTSSSVVL